PFFILLRPPRSPLFPYTTLFRSQLPSSAIFAASLAYQQRASERTLNCSIYLSGSTTKPPLRICSGDTGRWCSGQIDRAVERPFADRKSTRLNSSHVAISYAVFCL